jgi:GPI-anchor transamidase subunit S
VHSRPPLRQARAQTFLSTEAYGVALGSNIPRSVLKGRQILLSEQNLFERLADLLSLYPDDVASHGHRVTQYAPRYRVALSLLNEDATEGKVALSWDVRTATASKQFALDWIYAIEPVFPDHLEPVFQRLNVLHNFTIESQVQYQAPLAITPQRLDAGYGLAPEDLTVFINSAEWTLCQSNHLFTKGF